MSLSNCIDCSSLQELNARGRCCDCQEAEELYGPAVRCDSCGSVSANGVSYHKQGCATGKGGWSSEQRRAIDAIESRYRTEVLQLTQERDALQRRLDTCFELARLG